MSYLKKLRSIFLVCLSFWSFAYCTTKADANFKVNFPINVKVLLDEKSSIEKNIFTVNSKDSTVILQSPDIKQKITILNKNLDIIIRNNSIFIPVPSKQEKNLVEIKKTKSPEIQLTCPNGKIKINGRSYQGVLTFKIDKQTNKLLIINTLNLDDYLYSVLVSESYQSWPMEVQKVQVVAFRSYAVNSILKTRNQNDPKSYDIKRNNFHQTYNGFHKYVHLRKAIDETKDLILTHDNKVILAMFDACCGGITPAKMKVLDFKKAPYLARKQRCNFCKNYSLYQWKREMPEQDFIDRLKQNNKIKNKFNNCGKFRGISVTEKDKAGIVHKVKINCSKKKIELSGNDLWEGLRDKIKSLSFDIKKYRNKIIFTGHGFGHQMGLCQHGARELVKKGYDFRRILKFYYPQTNFAKLQYAKL